MIIIYTLDCDRSLNESECEKKIDSFLNSYCACEKDTHAIMTTSPSLPATSATTTVSPVHLQSNYTQEIMISQCSTATLTATIISPSCTQSVVYQPASTCAMPAVPTEWSSSTGSSLESSKNSIQTTCTNSVTALGVLLALAVVLLAVVTTGWVCTCFIMKKRQDPAQNRYM